LVREMKMRMNNKYIILDAFGKGEFGRRCTHRSCLFCVSFPSHPSSFFRVIFVSGICPITPHLLNHAVKSRRANNTTPSQGSTRTLNLTHPKTTQTMPAGRQVASTFQRSTSPCDLTTDIRAAAATISQECRSFRKKPLSADSASAACRAVSCRLML